MKKSIGITALGAGILAVLTFGHAAPTEAQLGRLGPPSAARPKGAGVPAGLPAERGEAVSANVLVNDPRGQLCGVDGCVQSETTIATNGGTVLYAGWNDSEGFFNPAAGVSGFGVSTDGGATWTDGGGLPQGAGLVAGDPSMAVCNDPNQVFYANLYVRTGQANPDISVHTGARAGNTVSWSAPVLATRTDSVFEDKEYLVCDRTNNNLYLAYTAFGFNGQIEFRRSTDGNQSWGPPVILQREEASTVNQGAYPATGPNGEVCVAWVRGWLTQLRPQIRLRCSIDQGRTFGPPVTVGTLLSNAFLGLGPAGYNRGVILESPFIDIDKSGGPNNGTIYVAWQTARGLLPQRRRYDVVLNTCTLSGDTPVCGALVGVNDTPNDGADDFWPWVSVAPDGSVGILWYSNTAGITDVFIDVSPNGGAGVDQRVTDVSSNWLAADADATPNFGDYINLTSSANGFHAVWGDGRRGDPDVFYATITP